MPPDIDWSDFQERAERANQIPDPGEYMLMCTSAEWDKTKDGLKDMLVLRHILVDEPDFDGFDIMTFQAYSPESRFADKMFADLLAAHQVDPMKDADGDSNVIAELCVSKTVTGVLEHTEYRGQTRARIRSFSAA